MNMADMQAKLQTLSEEFTKLQQDLQDIVQSRQKLEAQRQENLGVQKEFGKLKDGETIYKLIGPVLLKQEKTDAESTVSGRLEFINKEISAPAALRRRKNNAIPATACTYRHDLSWSSRPAMMRTDFSVTKATEAVSNMVLRIRSKADGSSRTFWGSWRLKMLLIRVKHWLRRLNRQVSAGMESRPISRLRKSMDASMLATQG
ncbi:Prefoldin [Chaetomium strumarium]|uniref:Prefoldin n=1 Tax=Chaetomium strumarium TaxID=1170767 RepID=A0AAJ0GTW4_9PEZI|nr:Prefoldin [Chaetomium strumarium]